MNVGFLHSLAQTGFDTLTREDSELAGLLVREHERQDGVLNMIAAFSPTDSSVLACQATAIANVTAEGYPGARYHGGTAVVDAVEELAIERAKIAFGACYANVQPHSGSSANHSVLLGLLEPGATLLGLDLASGGHLSHGASVAISGRLFRAVAYRLDDNGRVDLDQVLRLARQHRPRLIIAGASAYPRRIDFSAFRRIADEVGAYLVADISHIAGLVAAREHPSPIHEAHVTTMSTYKQLFGPRGGLILMGRDHDSPGPDGKGTLADHIQRAVFPLTQGTPGFASIAAKARALALATTERFRSRMRLVVEDAHHLARELSDRGYHLSSGGTDNHLILIVIGDRGLSGLVAERALEECNIIVNRNRVQGDTRPAKFASGIRLGTNGLAARNLGPDVMPLCAQLIHDVLSAVSPRDDSAYVLDPETRDQVRLRVAELCARPG